MPPNGISLEVKIDIHVFPKPAWIVITVGFGISKSFQNTVRLQQHILHSLTKIYQSYYKKFQRWRHLNWVSLNFILVTSLCFLFADRLFLHSHTCRNNLASDTTSLVDLCPSHESCNGLFKLLPINDCMVYKGTCVGTACLQRKP